MKNKYITPRILVEKMDVPLLVPTTKIPIFTDEPKTLDGKAFPYDIDVDDMEIGW